MDTEMKGQGDDDVFGPVSHQLVGEVWPAAQPGTDPVLYGHASLESPSAVEVRSFQTFTLRYTVGRYGLDETGAIRVVFRAIGDAKALQTRDPSAPNHVTAVSSTGVPLQVRYDHRGRSARPRWKSVTVDVTGGCLREGDVITIVLGDTAGGSPGWQVQTIAEAGFEFRVLADVCAVGHFVPIPDTPTVDIVPGDPVRWRAVLPTLRRPGESFRLGLLAEDLWGNPTDRASANLVFRPTVPVVGLPTEISFPTGQRSLAIDGLHVEEPGLLRIVVYTDSGQQLTETPPLVVRDGAVGGYWADMHGQSGESIGLTTARQYFDFARDCAFLDAAGHQANDFQVNNAFWSHLADLTAEFNDEGSFVTLPGYEWSGNTAVGGDRNVYFRTEGRPIRRSSHALLTDRSDIDSDASDANRLFAALTEAGEDCVVYAHVGGRYADVALAHDPRLETAMEIHSAWGTFEWLLTDGFALGHRCGVVCNSDGHKGRPGASYPGAATFGAYGGLTCFYAEELSRDGIFECLRRRHHFGTSGNRLHLEVNAAFERPAVLYERDPRVDPDAVRSEVRAVMMGDIIATDEDSLRLTVDVVAPSPVERVEVRNAAEVVEVIRPFSGQDLGRRFRVLWSGAEHRGRGRTTTWRGTARLTGANLAEVMPINIWNHEKRVERSDTNEISFDTITTGNYGGIELTIDNDDNIDGAVLELSTNHGDTTVDLGDLGLDDHIMEAGGLDRRLRVFRLPDENPERAMTATVDVALRSEGDNPIWVCVWTEDGFQAWSSPIFAVRGGVDVAGLGVDGA